MGWQRWFSLAPPRATLAACERKRTNLDVSRIPPAPDSADPLGLITSRRRRRKRRRKRRKRRRKRRKRRKRRRKRRKRRRKRRNSQQYPLPPPQLKEEPEEKNLSQLVWLY